MILTGKIKKVSRMRKNDVRKWIHAVLDMLPLVVIPAFMVYSHRHTIDSYSVTRQETHIVTNTYNVVNDMYGDFSTDSSYWDLSDSMDNHYPDGSYYYDYDELHFVGDWDFQLNYSEPFEYSEGDILYLQFYCDCDDLFDYFVNFDPDQQFDYTDQEDGAYRHVYFTSSGDLEVNFIFGGHSGTDFCCRDFQFFNLSEIFGHGNEPSENEFTSWLGSNYLDTGVSYPYVVSGEVIQTVTYDNNDIGSQLIYSMYNTIDASFNFNNVFNFNQIYDWLQLNIFGGTAPLSVFIAWNVFLYEFLMDLIFLLYALFMFFIDFCTSLIDRFHTKCSGGK